MKIKHHELWGIHGVCYVTMGIMLFIKQLVGG